MKTSFCCLPQITFLWPEMLNCNQNLKLKQIFEQKDEIETEKNSGSIFTTSSSDFNL